MNWASLFKAALLTIAQLAPSVLSQHWYAGSPDGKTQNAIQIIKDATTGVGTLEENLAASDAANNPHPELAAHAEQLAVAEDTGGNGQSVA